MQISDNLAHAQRLISSVTDKAGGCRYTNKGSANIISNVLLLRVMAL